MLKAMDEPLARGMWRWWEGPDGSEVWWAHVEFVPGRWGDMLLAEYESRGCQPSFWQLPLKDEYLEGVIG